jgi:hypothetical protein
MLVKLPNGETHEFGLLPFSRKSIALMQVFEGESTSMSKSMELIYDCLVQSLCVAGNTEVEAEKILSCIPAALNEDLMKNLVKALLGVEDGAV